MWRAYKKLHFKAGENQGYGSDSDSSSSGEDGQSKSKLPRLNLGKKRSVKYLNAESFLREMMEIYGDTMPTLEGTNATGEKQRKILPYETIKSLHREYIWQRTIEKVHPSEIAKKTCFTKVFLSMKDEIRLLGCKGIYIVFAQQRY